MALVAEIAHEFFLWLLSPLAWVTLAALGLVIGGLRARRQLVIASTLLAVLALFATTPMASGWLVRWLEAPLPSPAFCQTQPPSVAVVLGAGVDTFAGRSDDTTVLSIASRRRMESALEWWRQAPGRSLVVAGGRSPSGGDPVSRLMVRYATELGSGNAVVAIEESSENTWENARNLAHMTPALPRRVTLITSAMHMPRAAFAMRQAGFEVCPLPADPRRVPSADWWGYLFWPETSALAKTEDSVHELVGLAYYHLLACRHSRR